MPNRIRFLCVAMHFLVVVRLQAANITLLHNTRFGLDVSNQGTVLGRGYLSNLCGSPKSSRTCDFVWADDVGFVLHPRPPLGRFTPDDRLSKAFQPGGTMLFDWRTGETEYVPGNFSYFSADMNVAAGSDENGAVRWTAENGVQVLGTLPGHDVSGVEGISSDGRVIAGTSATLPSREDRAPFVWDPDGGMRAIPMLPGSTWCEAHDLSSDGSTVVGWCVDKLNDVGAGYMWTAASGTVPMPGLSGAHMIDSDGDFVVGTAESGWVVWDADHGVRSIGQLMSDLDVELPPNFSTDVYVDAMSDNGRYLLFGSSWDSHIPGVRDYGVVRLDLGSDLLGDANGDGSVNLEDLNIVRNNFGAVGDDVPGDIDDNGAVGLDDLNAVRNNFGLASATMSAGQPTPVPEPAAFRIVIVAAGLFAASAIRKRRSPMISFS